MRSDPRSPIGSVVTVGVLLAVVSFGLNACGDDRNVAAPTGGAGDTQPPPGASFSTSSAFDDLPLPPDAMEIGAKTEKDGAISQSFGVTATRPDVVMNFFVGALADQGWALVTPVEQRGTNSLYGAWDRDGRRLEVSAGPAPGIADDTQFNLVLLESLEPGRELSTAP